MNKRRKNFVAYFDILGYGRRIEKRSVEEEFNIQDEFITRLEDFIKGTKNIEKCELFNFSDTYILYIDDGSENSFIQIIYNSLICMLLAAVKKIPYFPFRGAISYGDFLVNKERNVIVGEALREAYLLEKRQQWMGCCLSNSCYEKVKDYAGFKWFKDRGVLVKYKVPFKDKEGHAYTEDRWVINIEAHSRIWARETKGMPIATCEFIENIFTNKGMNNNDILNLDNETELKMKNTQHFFKRIKEIKNSFE